MSSINTKPQVLNNIAGVEDLTNENAEAVSGGFIPALLRSLIGGARAVQAVKTAAKVGRAASKVASKARISKHPKTRKTARRGTAGAGVGLGIWGVAKD